LTRFSVLGPLTADEDGRSLAIGGPKQRALLAVLLIAEGRPVSADALIEELWGDDSPPTAAAALQVYVSGLRKVFGSRVHRSAGGYAIDVHAGELDAAEFTRLVAEAREIVDEQPAQAAAKLKQALALWQGEPLFGAGDGGAVEAARARLTEQRLTATEDRIDCDLALGNHQRVVPELVELVSRNPLRERLTGQLMLALYRSGRVSEAEAAYRTLAGELGAEPSDRLTALAAAIRRHDPTLDAPPTVALPLPASRFIGRRRERDRIEDLLGRSRMLTLVGPGGTGKTRLALQLSRDLGPQYPDGVYFIELAGSAEEASVTGRVAAAIGVRELPGESLTETLVARLRYARALIVLDNCEHVVDAAAVLAADLLRGCTGLRLLATSREPLQIAGETVVPVEGLEVPAPDAPYDEAIRSEALRLLADRGAGARGGFRIEPGTVRSAIAVCRRLDGLPLAIEIAAAGLRILSLPDLERRLDRRLDLRLAESRTLPHRHRTIRATIEWSHDLLDKDERALFRRLAVFAGGFTLAAAEHVGADPDGDPPRRPGDVLDLLTRLVHRSLLTPDLDTDLGPDLDTDRDPDRDPNLDAGGTRYRMLETVQEYAAERLAGSADRRGTAERHADWYRQLVEEAPQFGGEDHTFWLRRLTAELDNLRTAMEWSLSPDGDQYHHSRALAIATRLWWYWWSTGQMTEGRDWLRRALDASDQAASPARGDALRAAAALARNSGHLDEARTIGEQALAVQQELGDSRGLAMAWNNLCMTATGQRDFEAALRYAEGCRREAERAGDERGLAIAANNTATVLRCVGRLDEAEAGFGESLERFRRCGDHRGEAAAVFNLGVVAARRDNRAEAREHYLRSLALYRDLQLAEGELDALEALACLDAVENRRAEAWTKLRVAERERRRLGAPTFVPDEIDSREAALAVLGEPPREPRTAEPTLDELVAAELSGRDGRRS
jgi:predicted ATPase/DNA-binding SARP family transcriptional activator